MYCSVTFKSALLAVLTASTIFSAAVALKNFSTVFWLEQVF